VVTSLKTWARGGRVSRTNLSGKQRTQLQDAQADYYSNLQQIPATLHQHSVTPCTVAYYVVAGFVRSGEKWGEKWERPFNRKKQSYSLG
jgi:hypothetical protein